MNQNYAQVPQKKTSLNAIPSKNQLKKRRKKGKEIYIVIQILTFDIEIWLKENNSLSLN